MRKVNIQVDFGYAFDFLSIYEVKINKVNTVQNVKNFTETYHYLKEQIDERKFFEVMDSKEYADLLKANEELFDLVDLAKKDAVKASVVDAGVYKRFLAKRALLEKFFPEAEKVEQKFGYDNSK